MSKKDAKGKVEKDEEHEIESMKLQALVIAENIGQGVVNFCFQKCPFESPLRRVFHLLEKNDVSDIIVFCADAQKVEDEKAGKKWKSRIETVYSQNCHTIGDIIREVDKMERIKMDFILIYGNIISEVNLKDAIKQFKAKASKKLKFKLMKLFVQEETNTPANFRDRNFVMIDTNTNQLKYFEPITEGLPLSIKENTCFNFKSLVDEGHNERVDIRFDLEDAGISLCSHEILNEYNENTDYANEQLDMINKNLTLEFSEEKLMAYVIPAGLFHIKVNNSYKMLRACLLQLKGCFPDFIFDHTVYKTNLKDNLVLPKDLQLSRKTILQNNTLIAAGCVIGDNCRLSNSVICSKAQIGDGCQLSRVYVGPGVVVAANTIADSAVFLSDEGHNLEEKIREGVLRMEANSSRKDSVMYQGEEHQNEKY